MAAAWASANADPTTSTADTQMDVTAPTGITVLAGELLVAFGYCVQSRSLTAPTGFSNVTGSPSSTTDGNMYVWTKIPDSGDAAAGTFTFTASGGFNSAVCSLHRASGINTAATPTIAFGTGPNDTNQTTPTITLPSAGCLVFYGLGQGQSGSSSGADKGTKRIDSSNATSGCFMTQYTEVVSGSGSNTGATITTSAFGLKRTVSVAFEASGGGGGGGLPFFMQRDLLTGFKQGNSGGLQRAMVKARRAWVSMSGLVVPKLWVPECAR